MRRRSNSHHENNRRPHHQELHFADQSFHSDLHPEENRISITIEQIGDSLNQKNFHQAGRLLSFLLNELNPPLAKIEIQRLLNTPYHFGSGDSKNSILELLIINDAPPKTLHKFFEYGISAGYLFAVEDSFIPKNIKDKRAIVYRIYEDCNLVHLAAKELNVVALLALTQYKIDFNLRNNNGLTPLTLLMEIHLIDLHPSSRKSFNSALGILLNRLDVDAKYPTPQHPFCYALERYDLKLARDILNLGMSLPLGTEDKSYTISKDGLDQKVSFLEIAKEVLELGLIIESMKPEYDEKLPMELIYEGCNFYRLTSNIQHLYYYFMSYLEMVNETEIHQDRSFTKLTMLINNAYSPVDIQALLAHVEIYHDGVFERNGKQFSPDYHQNEAEFMLLLAHPELTSNFNTKTASSITRVMTSPYRYVDYNLKTIDLASGGWKTISNWQRIGQLTHSFLNWRFDSLHPTDPEYDFKLPALIEDFGFKQLNIKPETISRYGSCYLLKPGEMNLNFISRTPEGEELINFNKKSVFYFARGYLMFSDPNFGTLLIRNSSLVFGRDKMHHPAYYTPRFRLTPIFGNDFENMEPILSKKINGVNDGRFPAKEHRDQIRFLTEAITGILDAYNRWKFNTDPATSFRPTKGTISNNEIIGAYNSVGFESVVRNLRAMYEMGKKTNSPTLIPSLAMTHRYSPPWNSFPFDQFVPENGGTILQRKFTLDDYRLEVMESLARGEYDSSDFKNSGLQSFFQVGINFQANLTIISAK